MKYELEVVVTRKRDQFVYSRFSQKHVCARNRAWLHELGPGSRAALVCQDDFQPGITWGEPARFRAVTNFSSRRGIVKSSRGTKKVWCYSRGLLLSGGGGRERLWYGGGWGFRKIQKLFVGCRTETNLYYTFNNFFLTFESPFES